MDTGNRGVSALGSALIGLLLKSCPQATPVLLVASRNNTPAKVYANGSIHTVPVVNFRVSPRKDLKNNLFLIAGFCIAWRLVRLNWVRKLIQGRVPWINLVATADIVGDIRGGDSFSDIYGLRSFILASLPVLCVIWLRRDIILFPQTYGPYRHLLARRIASYITRHSSLVLARDGHSLEVARNTGANPHCTLLCPDVAFTLPARNPIEPKITPPLEPSTAARVIGLNISGLLYNVEKDKSNVFGLKLNYPTFVEALVTALLEDGGIHILLLPHTYAPAGEIESDTDACRKLISNIGQTPRIHLVASEYDQHELKGLISQCSFFIGSRMHACIAALSQGIPTVGVAYSDKFRGVFATVGAEDCVIDGRITDGNSAVSQIFDRLRYAPAIRRRLAEVLPITKANIAAAFATFPLASGNAIATTQ